MKALVGAFNQEEEALTDGSSAALVGVEAQNAGIEEVAETITHNLFRINMRLLILVSVVLFFLYHLSPVQ